MKKFLNKKWEKAIFSVAVVMLAAGVGLILFPPISNLIGSIIANSQVEEFEELAENIQGGSYEEALNNGEIDEEGYPIDEDGNRTSNTPCVYEVDVDRLYEDSLAYNEDLKTTQYNKLTNEYAYSVASINLRNYGIYNGIYGYVSAPTINMKLPIYLGANNANMSYGAAHLTYTSLPMGGESTNTVLAGHTGYIGRIFFDNIRKLQIGDEVYLTTYWSTLTYKVARAEICLPNESQDIFIAQDEDLLTLVTCISNGSGDFNRYLVICERA